MIQIITERLKVVPLSLEYAQEIFNEFTEEISTFLHPKPPEVFEDTINYIKSQIPKIENGDELPVVILKKDSGEFLGCGGIHKLKSDSPELGIWIKKSAHGHHYGREAVTGLKEWAEKHLSYEYLTYPVDKQNISSRKIAESLGGTVRAEYKKVNMSGNTLDEVEYWIYKTK
jgi:[ribosomal protein S5]-alanine N-acetyltransferase